MEEKLSLSLIPIENLEKYKMYFMKMMESVERYEISDFDLERTIEMAMASIVYLKTSGDSSCYEKNLEILKKNIKNWLEIINIPIY